MKKIIYTFGLFSIAFVISLQAQSNTCDVFVGDTAVLETHSDVKIGVFGNLENNGSISDNDGLSEVGFYNSENALEIAGTNKPEFANLIVDVPQDLQVNVSTEITSGVLFLDGRIITPRDQIEASLDLINTDVTVNVDDNHHVDGYTSYTGSQQYTFPIGDNLRFRPITIEENTALTTSKAAYFFENPASNNSFSLDLNINTTDNDVFNVSSFEFWDLDGTTPTSVTLTWDVMSNISQIINSNNLNELIVTGWSKEEQQWVNLGNVSVTGDLSQGSITSTPFNPDDFEAITFATSSNVGGDEDEATELIVFNGISNGEENRLNDFLGIQNISLFPENNLKIFNRWGVKVYEADGYDAEPTSSPLFSEPTNAFTGKSNGRITVKGSDLLPVGTYYYILTYIADVQGGEKTLAGYLYINR